MREPQARKFLWRHRNLLDSPRYGRLGQPKKWPAMVVEQIRQLQGRPAETTDPQSDWLARYQEGTYGKDRAEPPGER